MAQGLEVGQRVNSGFIVSALYELFLGHRWLDVTQVLEHFKEIRAKFEIQNLACWGLSLVALVFRTQTEFLVTLVSLSK